MELGDIVSWVPTYSKNTSAQMPLWLGVVIEKDDSRKLGQVKVCWFSSQDGHYGVDWTPASELKLVSRV
jgi:hypothetical protein